MKIEREQVSIIDFETNHKEMSNSMLLEKIYTENDVVSKLKKSDNLYVYELINVANNKPLFSFLFNKGFMKGKTICVLLTHRYIENTWDTQISEPFIKDGEEWVNGKFRTKARDEEFSKVIKSGEIWK